MAEQNNFLNKTNIDNNLKQKEHSLEEQPIDKEKKSEEQDPKKQEETELNSVLERTTGFLDQSDVLSKKIEEQKLGLESTQSTVDVLGNEIKTLVDQGKFSEITAKSEELTNKVKDLDNQKNIILETQTEDISPLILDIKDFLIAQKIEFPEEIDLDSINKILVEFQNKTKSEIKRIQEEIEKVEIVKKEKERLGKEISEINQTIDNLDDTVVDAEISADEVISAKDEQKNAQQEISNLVNENKSTEEILESVKRLDTVKNKAISLDSLFGDYKNDSSEETNMSKAKEMVEVALIKIKEHDPEFKDTNNINQIQNKLEELKTGLLVQEKKIDEPETINFIDGQVAAIVEDKIEVEAEVENENKAPEVRILLPDFNVVYINRYLQTQVPLLDECNEISNKLYESAKFVSEDLNSISAELNKNKFINMFNGSLKQKQTTKQEQLEKIKSLGDELNKNLTNDLVEYKNYLDNKLKETQEQLFGINRDEKLLMDALLGSQPKSWGWKALIYDTGIVGYANSIKEFDNQGGEIFKKGEVALFGRKKYIEEEIKKIPENERMDAEIEGKQFNKEELQEIIWKNIEGAKEVYLIAQNIISEKQNLK